MVIDACVVGKVVVGVVTVVVVGFFVVVGGEGFFVDLLGLSFGGVGLRVVLGFLVVGCVITSFLVGVALE